MADFISSCAGAFVEVPSSSEVDYEGFIISKVAGVPEYHWIRVQGVDPRTGSPAHARLEASPSLEQLLGGAGALGQVCSRLRSAPSVQHFLADLQEVLERLAYGSAGRLGPGSRAGGGGGGGSSSISSSRVMQLLLRDLDELGWDSLEELDQDAANMTLVYVDEHGREHRLRLTLPYDYPASGPAATTDLPMSFQFTWRSPMPPPPPAPPPPQPPPTGSRPRSGQHLYGSGGGGGGGNGWWAAAPGAPEGSAGTPTEQQHRQHQHHHHHQHHHQQQHQHQPARGCENPGGGDRSAGTSVAGGGGGGGGCSSLADVFRAFKLAVSAHQPLWRCLDLLDRRTRVLDPPPSVSASRRHLGGPTRRVALGSTAVSLQLRLDPSDPLGPPPPGGVAFLGPPEAAAQLREGFFGRLHLWDWNSDIVENLEMLLGQPLPAPQGTRGGGDPWKEVEEDECEGEDSAPQQRMAECPICMMHLLPVGDDDDGEDEEAMTENTDGDDADAFYLHGRGAGRGGGAAAGGGRGGAAGSGGGAGAGAGALRGLVPDVVCPTPACGLTFHTPCLAEWLRSLHDTRVSFSKLFGRCPFCSNPITVRA